MSEVTQKTPATRLVWNFSETTLSFDHVKFMALWLQVPDTNMLGPFFQLDQRARLGLLGPACGSPVKNVQYMHFGGSPLPTIIEDPMLQTPGLEKVSLGLAETALAQNAWVDSWTTKARYFKQQAYGQPLQ